MVELQYFARVILAAICGIAIGYERKNRAKEAGIRTHCIVACAAALIMVVSKYGFFDLIESAYREGVEVKLDPSRIASCIVSGVGFLGAGMIFVQKQTVKGLTTAAGIWATAGIGMAIGAGLYIIGILVTILILFAQFLLHKDSRFLRVPHYKLLKIKSVDKKGYQKELTSILKQNNIEIEEINVTHDDKMHYTYLVTIGIPQDMNEEEVLSLFEYDASLKLLK